MAAPTANVPEDDTAPDSQIDNAAALEYWSAIPADVNGMLGGFGSISHIDLRGSANFVTKLRRRSAIFPQSDLALPCAVDCGAGIGRVTEGLLSKLCDVVDVVEPVARFVKEILEGERMEPLRQRGKIGDVWTEPLESWNPEPAKYTLIWNQWCLGHLKDAELVAYLSRCRQGLQPGGWIVVKENLSTDTESKDLFDPLDNSVTRTDDKFLALFQEAKLSILQTELQLGFPKGLGLFPVRSYALQPIDAAHD
ncbi:MAG: Alpha N-terminal protein methyltransferase 1 [Lichina confinis]|nr:MAG: Alpha N-terminal protein methyltransferase 1 [Lichina confinis]